MKKIFSIFLSALMCFTCVLAAPAPVSTVETAGETATEEIPVVEEAAQLTQETDIVKSLFVKFENAVSQGFTCQDVNEPSKDNGVFEFTSKIMDPRITFPITFKADDYDSVVVRMKWEGIVRENSSPCAQLFYMGTDKDGNTVNIGEAYSKKVYTELS